MGTRHWSPGPGYAHIHATHRSLCHVFVSPSSQVSLTKEEEYPFGFWYDGEMAEQLRSGRIPRTTRNLSNNDRSVVLRAISNFRKERKRQMKEPHDIHHEVFTELLTRWRNLLQNTGAISRFQSPKDPKTFMGLLRRLLSLSLGLDDS